MKEIWIEAYSDKLDECIEEGMTEAHAEIEAAEWANGAFERLLDHADTMRKAMKEDGL